MFRITTKELYNKPNRQSKQLAYLRFNYKFIANLKFNSTKRVCR